MVRLQPYKCKNSHLPGVKRKFAEPYSGHKGFTASVRSIFMPEFMGIIKEER